MLSSQEEQIERARTLENDRKVREQGSTFLSHTHSDLGGRYALVSPQTLGASRQAESNARRVPR